MADPLFRTVALDYCQAVMFEQWNPPRGRFYVAYRTRHGFTSLLGHGVVDEFRTISGPVLLAPSALLGGIYDAGMRLADARDVEAPLDMGWPPLTIGIDVKNEAPGAGWQQDMITAMQQQAGRGTTPWNSLRRRGAAGDYSIDVLLCSLEDERAATVIVTDAPMLPQQLERLADVDNAPITVAVSKGNRLPYVEAGQLHEVDVVPDGGVKQAADTLRQLLL